MQPNVTKVQFNGVGDQLPIELVKGMGCNNSQFYVNTGFSFPREKCLCPSLIDKNSP